jgi:excisionase family DNA binding protein
MPFLKSECDMSENHRQESNTQSPAISKYGGTQTDKRAMDTIPFAQRLSCTVAEACAATGLGRTKLYELIGAGSVATTLIGRRRLVSVKSLLHLIAPEASTQIRG